MLTVHTVFPHEARSVFDSRACMSKATPVLPRKLAQNKAGTSRKLFTSTVRLINIRGRKLIAKQRDRATVKWKIICLENYN